MQNFQDIDFNLSFNNFNPDDIQTDETINAVFVVDVSPSIHTYVKDLNHAFNDFVASMQQSHVADHLLVSVIEFNEKVMVRTGFQPILQVPNIQFKPCGGGTALYDATLQGLKQAVDYRSNLEASGVTTKTLLFVITDGEDNSSQNQASRVKTELNKILANEQNVFSFTTILFGVGHSSSFGKAQQEMGLQHLAKVGTSGAEIKKMIGFISQSISSASSGQNIVF
ncbi:MAG: vWA domain-containing protein [Chitinophagales bacterium]